MNFMFVDYSEFEFMSNEVSLQYFKNYFVGIDVC